MKNVLWYLGFLSTLSVLYFIEGNTDKFILDLILINIFDLFQPLNIISKCFLVVRINNFYDRD